MEKVITLEDQGIDVLPDEEVHDAKVRKELRVPLYWHRESATTEYKTLIGYYLLPSGIITTPRSEISTLARRSYGGGIIYNNKAHMRRQQATMTKDFTYRGTD